MDVATLLRTKPEAVVTVSPDSDIAHAVELLLEHNIGGLPVLDDGGRLVGFAAERDLLRALHLDPDTDEGLPIRRVMRSPAPTCAPSDDVLDAMGRMTRNRLRHLVVVDGHAIVGVLSVGDIVKHRLEQLETETAVLRDVIAGNRARG
jgi:CBS domain-containing protein